MLKKRSYKTQTNYTGAILYEGGNTKKITGAGF